MSLYSTNAAAHEIGVTVSAFRHAADTMGLEPVEYGEKKTSPNMWAAADIERIRLRLHGTYDAMTSTDEQMSAVNMMATTSAADIRVFTINPLGAPMFHTLTDSANLGPDVHRIATELAAADDSITFPSLTMCFVWNPEIEADVVYVNTASGFAVVQHYRNSERYGIVRDGPVEYDGATLAASLNACTTGFAHADIAVDVGQ